MKTALENFRKLYAKYEAQIEGGIESYRKGDFNLSVRDSEGKPVGCEVSVKQINHDFDFGVAPFMLGDMNENEQSYRDAVTDLFNLITTTFCWSVMETSEGVYRFNADSEYIYRRPPSDYMLNFAKENGLRIKGQPLLADSWHPKWASRDPEELKKQIRNYMAVVAERYEGKFYLFDVVNESLLAEKRTPDFPLLQEGSAFEYVKWALNTASELFSNNTILERNDCTGVNYGDKADQYYLENKALIEEGIRLDSIGFQFHFMSDEGVKNDLMMGRYNIDHLMETYHRMSSLGVPMYITEITVPTVYNGFTWEEGEELQAEILDKLYHLWFSIPSMKGIIFWNLKDGDTWKGESDCMGCLLDINCKRKKSYFTLQKLIKEEWNTSFNTDLNNGECSFRGFYGEYDVLIKHNGKEIVKKVNFNKLTEKIDIII